MAMRFFCVAGFGSSWWAMIVRVALEKVGDTVSVVGCQVEDRTAYEEEKTKGLQIIYKLSAYTHMVIHTSILSLQTQP